MIRVVHPGSDPVIESRTFRVGSDIIIAEAERYNFIRKLLEQSKKF
jgi:hypothetical protein